MSSQDDFKKVSIIIPTYNRAKIIGQTIESCINQTYPKDRFEIIVADNNSSDNTRSVVEQWKQKSSVPIIYLFEPRQGAHYARNSAAMQSDSEILYFTDDDMIVEKDALRNIVRVFDLNYNVAAAGGRVLPKWEFEPPEWLLKYFKNGSLSLIDKSEKLVIASYDLGLYSCHQAILRKVLLDCGGFNPDIVKDELVGNGETGLNIKILQEGYNFAYAGDSIAYHMIPGTRMTQKYLNYRFGNQGNCDSFTIFRKNENSKKVLLKMILFSHIPAMIRYYSNSVVERITNNDMWRLHRTYASYFFHRIKSDFRFATDNNRREFALKYDYLKD